MSTQSYEQLIAGANKIRENELPESNTHTLVGEQMLQMVNKQQEADDQCKSEVYNVSRYHTQVDGSRIFTLAQAIDVVPARLRISGAVIKFKTSTKEVIAFFDGDIANWSNVNLWRTVIDNKDFEYAEKTGNKDQPGGYAGLDENGLVPTSSLSPNPLETESQNIVGAINELQTGKVDSESIVQELGDSDNLVLSQKAAKNLLQDRKEKDAAGGYAGLDDEGKIDNRRLRQTNGYYSPSLSTPIRVDHSDKLNVGTGDFTIELIFNIKQGYGSLINKGDNAEQKFILYVSTSKVLQFFINGSGINKTLELIKNLIYDIDYHCVITRDNNVINTFINGELISSYEVPQMDLSSIVPLIIGGNQLYFNVSLFRQFNRGFSQSDVDYYYNNGRPDQNRLLYSDTNINTTELISGGDFESGLIGNKSDGDGSSSTWTLNTISPVSGTRDGKFVVTTGTASSLSVPYVTFPANFKASKKYRVSFKYKLSSGTIASKIRTYDGSTVVGTLETLEGFYMTNDIISYIIDIKKDYSVVVLYFDTRGDNLIDIQLDDISAKEIGSVLELLPENATPTKWLGTQQSIDGITSGSPTINYGNFYKKEELLDDPSFIESEKTGDSSGVTRITVICSKSNIATIEGGEFFDKTGAVSLGQSVQLFANIATYLYWKNIDSISTIRMSNLDIIDGVVQYANGPNIIGTIKHLNFKKKASLLYGNTVGALKDLSASAEYLNIAGSVKIIDDIINAPRNLTTLSISNSSGTVTGLIKNFPRRLTFIGIYNGSGHIGGDIADLPTGAKYIQLHGGASSPAPFSYTQGHVFASTFDTLVIRAHTYGSFTTTMLDNLFIDLNSSVTVATGQKLIELKINLPAPTAASLAARTELTAKGFTILTN